MLLGLLNIPIGHNTDYITANPKNLDNIPIPTIKIKIYLFIQSVTVKVEVPKTEKQELHMCK